MKAADRCRCSHQGDRCRLPVDHAGNHEGTWATWNASGVLRSTTITVPRNRYANRLVRGYDGRHVAPADRPQAIKALTNAIKYLRGTGDQQPPCPPTPDPQLPSEQAPAGSLPPIRLEHDDL